MLKTCKWCYKCLPTTYKLFANIEQVPTVGSPMPKHHSTTQKAKYIAWHKAAHIKKPAKPMALRANKVLGCCAPTFLQVYYLIVSSGGGFHQGLAHSRVRVHTLNNFMAGGFQLAGSHYFGNHFGYVGANHVGT